MQIAQRTLDSNKPAYKGVCCKACYYAKGEKCVCRCGGMLHGVGLEKWGDDIAGSFHLPYDVRRIFIELLIQKKCRWCDADLTKEPIRAYPHSDGWTLPDRVGSYWLYIRCPICAYEWALWKLGVDRE